MKESEMLRESQWRDVLGSLEDYPPRREQAVSR